MKISNSEFEAAVEAFACWHIGEPEPVIDVGGENTMPVSIVFHRSDKSDNIMPRSLHSTILTMVRGGHIRHFPESGATYARGRQEMIRLAGER